MFFDAFVFFDAVSEINLVYSENILTLVFFVAFAYPVSSINPPLDVLIHVQEEDRIVVYEIWFVISRNYFTPRALTGS